MAERVALAQRVVQLDGQLVHQVGDLATGDALGQCLQHRVDGPARRVLVEPGALGDPGDELVAGHLLDPLPARFRDEWLVVPRQVPSTSTGSSAGVRVPSRADGPW
jgi:hypothetical protein